MSGSNNLLSIFRFPFFFFIVSHSHSLLVTDETIPFQFTIINIYNHFWFDVEIVISQNKKKNSENVLAEKLCVLLSYMCEIGRYSSQNTFNQQIYCSIFSSHSSVYALTLRIVNRYMHGFWNWIIDLYIRVNVRREYINEMNERMWI